MQNEHLFRQNLEVAIENYIEENFTEGAELGWMPENLARLASDAAFAVLMANKAVQDYMKRDGLDLV